MISIDDVTVTYPDCATPAVNGACVHVAEGEMCLVIGPTGAGKSTLLGVINGLVPHFSGGTLAGRVTVAGRDTRVNRPRDLADVVGVVLQDPARGFVAETVADELTYAMEQLGLSRTVMRTRLEETLDLLGLVDLRDVPLRSLSGGEAQRVAIGAVLTTHPKVLVLDEPTSALDPAAADAVLAALTRLVHDQGLTVVLAEHRLERVIQYADLLVVVHRDGTVRQGPPSELLATAEIVPPLVELANVAGWRPVPLSVRDARRRVAELRARLSAPSAAPPTPDPVLPSLTRLRAVGVHVSYPRVHAVRGVDLTLDGGTVTALMGRNGSGKSSLLWALAGAGPRSGGSVAVGTDAHAGQDPAELNPEQARSLVALVPQNPEDLLYLSTVAAECEASDRQAGADAGTTAGLLTTFATGVDSRANPRDLSEGQRLALVLAIQLAAGPQVLLLDEPTRGLDYATKRALISALQAHVGAGGAVLVASHDVEFVAQCADRVVVLADGAVTTDGGVREVLVASPTFAPQVSRVLSPLAMLTVAEVERAMAR